MIIEYAKAAIKQVRERLAEIVDPMAPRKYGAVHGRVQRFCPRHGDRYVLRRGTNRCPVGRKRKVNCA